MQGQFILPDPKIGPLQIHCSSNVLADLFAAPRVQFNDSLYNELTLNSVSDCCCVVCSFTQRFVLVAQSVEKCSTCYW